MKTKKVLSSLLLAFILLLSSLLLFACGKNETSQSTFKEFTSFITEIESEKSVLVNSKIAQGETDFAFKDFSQKDEFAQKDSTIYDHYSILVGVGLPEIIIICSVGVSYDYCSSRVSWVQSGEPCQLPLKSAS